MVPRRLVLGLFLQSFVFAWLPAQEMWADEGEPVVKAWVPPKLPAALQGSRVQTEVVVEFVVDANGSVTAAQVAASPDPRLDEAALASVRAWQFEPAISGGNPVPVGMRVPILFGRDDAVGSLLPPVKPQLLPRTSPSVKRWGSIDDPPVMQTRKLGGNVVVEFTVTPEGRAQRPRVVAADSADLILAALAGLAQTEFEPARQGSLLTVPAVMQAPFEFAATSQDRDEQLVANGIRPVDAEAWSALRLAPVPIVYCEPVYPFESLLAGTEGEAAVRFTVDRAGGVSAVAVTTASQPEFGAALVAAVQRWVFRPAQAADGKTEVELEMVYRFDPAAEPWEASARLADLLRPGGAGVPGARGLDEKLTPLYRVGPVLAETSGANEAMVEFVIDREGRARVPRLTRTTDPDFGWAALTAVNQWVFAPPRRGGEPTDVKVAIPISHRP